MTLTTNVCVQRFVNAFQYDCIVSQALQLNCAGFSG